MCVRNLSSLNDRFIVSSASALFESRWSNSVASCPALSEKNNDDTNSTWNRSAVSARDGLLSGLVRPGVVVNASGENLKIRGASK